MREKRGSKTKTNNVVALVWFRSSLIGRGKKRGGDERSGLKMTGPDVCLVFDGSLYVRKINRIYIYIDRNRRLSEYGIELHSKSSVDPYSKTFYIENRLSSCQL